MALKGANVVFPYLPEILDLNFPLLQFLTVLMSSIIGATKIQAMLG